MRTPWPPILHRMVKSIRSRRLCEPGQHLLVAVSGGPDSVALLRLLHRLAPRWKLRLTAVHFNYGLRGAESDADQAFVETLCESLSLPLRCLPLNARVRARRVSVQAQARTLRYQAMMAVAEECGADRIALGHTADDQAETVMLWLLRGAGLTGLAGMPAAREDCWIRPLYDLRRGDLVAWLDAMGQAYRIDSSNAKPVYVRNRIRREVLPALTRMAPAAIEAFCRVADLCREDETYLEEQAARMAAGLVHEEANHDLVVDRDALRSLPLALQRRVLRHVLRRCDALGRPPSMSTIESVRGLLVSRLSSATRSCHGFTVCVTQSQLRVMPGRNMGRLDAEGSQAPEIAVTLPFEIEWAGTGQRIRVQLMQVQEVPSTGTLSAWRIIVDADRVGAPLMLRTWRQGDRLMPAGMKGRSKKLQDLFVDLKVPRVRRKQVPLLVSTEGIVGVLGYREDERFLVSAATRRCLVVSVVDAVVDKGER